MFAMKQFEIKNVFDGTKIVIPFYQRSMLCHHYLQQNLRRCHLYHINFHYLKLNNLSLIIISLQLIIHFLNHLVKNLI